MIVGTVVHLVLKVVSIVHDSVVVCESCCVKSWPTDVWLLYMEIGSVDWFTVGLVLWPLYGSVFEDAVGRAALVTSNDELDSFSGVPNRGGSRCDCGLALRLYML